MGDKQNNVTILLEAYIDGLGMSRGNIIYNSLE